MISFVLFMVLFFDSEAQYHHITHQGKIEYEVKINRFERTRKLLGAQASSAKYRDYVLSLRNNRFLMRNYEMDFDRKRSLYALMDENQSQDFIDLLIGIPTTAVFRDMETDSIFVKKQFGEEEFLIIDKPERIKWKYTDERMEIQGYECRRANGLYMDSIYVVAFYCPEIDVAGGPAVFFGLPGMILGLSVPEEHIHIFATEVNLNFTVKSKTSSLPRGPNRMTFSSFQAYLKSLLGDRFAEDKWEITKRGISF